MDMTALMIPQGNDVVVTARFSDISDGTGLSSEFWRKPNKNIPDDAVSVVTYQASVVADPDNAGQTMSQYTLPAADNGVPGSYWWRVDVVDVTDKRRTANCGTLLVEAV